MNRADLHQLLSDSSALPRTTTLFREAALRTLLLHLKAAERIPEHQTRGSILVQCVAGQGIFFIGEDQIELRPGVLISVPAAVSHSVTAAGNEAVSLLVTLAEQVAAEQ